MKFMEPPTNSRPGRIGGGGGRRGREGVEKVHPTLMDLGFTSLHTKHYVSNVQLHVVICYVLTYIMPCFY
jgi:hypothetical protein